jgi:hypothetical protein
MALLGRLLPPRCRCGERTLNANAALSEQAEAVLRLRHARVGCFGKPADSSVEIDRFSVAA